MRFISIFDEVRRQEKLEERLNRMCEEYDRANAESGECRQGTGITTSIGEKLCRLPAGHSGAHSPRREGGDAGC